jgi:glycine/D-amino acid oxidase-like deaminating enzyme
MKIAIIGAGFSGLAMAWHFLQSAPNPQITLFDAKGIGGGASGLAAGLLHPFSGAHAKLNWMGREGMASTLKLLKAAAAFAGEELYQQNGILRPAVDEDQVKDYRQCAEKYPETCWLDVQEVQKRVKGIAPFPALWIQDGVAVDCPRYLQALWAICAAAGGEFFPVAIQRLDELKEYDCVVVAAGAALINYPEFQHIALKPLKGQILLLEWPKQVPPLPFPVNSYMYLVMDRSRTLCWAGSTFERNALSEAPDMETAKALILPDVFKLIPDLAHVPVRQCLAGMRAVTSDHKPLYGRFGDKLWGITGLGSKGLLYHAYCAEQLVKEILDTL